MIGKIMKNNSFRATSRYVLEKEQAGIIGGNLFGQDLDTIVREFMMSKSLNSEIERPVYHLTQSYSYADKDGGKLTDERLEELATLHFAGMVISATEPELLDDIKAFNHRINRFLEEEIHDYQFFVAVHQDRGHVHTHLVASRINLRDSKCVPTWYERVRNQKVCRILEKQFGLEQLQNSRDIKKPDQAIKKRIVQTAPVMAELLKLRNGEEMKGAEYTLRQQGQTITYERSDGTIALKAYQNRQGDWTARRGDLSQQEWQRWQQLSAEQSRYQLAAGLKSKAGAAKKQEEDVNRLTSIIRAIWKRERVNRPKLKNVTFGDYRIRVEEGQPELFKRDLKLLGWSEGRCESYELTSQDVDAIDRYNLLSQKQSEDRLKDQQDRANATSQAQKDGR